MKENLKILVPYDGSTHSTNAVLEAIDLAKKYSGSLTLLNVHWDPGATGEYDGTEIRDQPVIQLFEDVENDLKKSGVSYELRYESDANAPQVILNVSKEGGYDAFAAVLTVSPHKDAALINRLGAEAGLEFGVEYLPTDLKKMDGFKTSVQFSREMGIYRQDYCGCEYSQRQKAGGRREEKK